jgi:hypothetical protein
MSLRFLIFVAYVVWQTRYTNLSDFVTLARRVGYWDSDGYSRKCGSFAPYQIDGNLYTDLVHTIKYEYWEGEFKIHRSEKTEDINNQWRELKEKYPHLKVHVSLGPHADMFLDLKGMLFDNIFPLKNVWTHCECFL